MCAVIMRDLRFQSVGVVNNEVVFIVWTPGGQNICIISMAPSQ